MVLTLIATLCVIIASCYYFFVMMPQQKAKEAKDNVKDKVNKSSEGNDNISDLRNDGKKYAKSAKKDKNMSDGIEDESKI